MDPDWQEAKGMRLAMAISRLRARLRDESRASATGISLSHLSVLRRLRRDGPATAAAIAAAEHVTQQAISQTVARLKKEGLVQVGSDTQDARKRLVEMTPLGEAFVGSILASRDAWLVRAIEHTISEEERPELEKAIELLERLADTHLGPETDIR